MKEILKKHSPPMTSHLVGDDIEAKKIYPSQPEKVFDLHGYTSEEVSRKIPWILEYSESNRYERIRIVTGVGKNILFTAAKNALNRKKSKIREIKLGTGVIEVYL